MSETTETWNPMSVYDEAPAGTTPAEPSTPEPIRRRHKASTSRPVALTIAIVRLERHQRELLAGLAGLKAFDDGDDDLARLVSATLDASVRLAKTVFALLSISGADPLEAGVLATELAADRATLSAVWGALGTGPVPRERPGLALAKAAQGLTKAQLDDLTTLAETLR